MKNNKKIDLPNDFKLKYESEGGFKLKDLQNFLRESNIISKASN